MSTASRVVVVAVLMWLFGYVAGVWREAKTRPGIVSSITLGGVPCTESAR